MVNQFNRQFYNPYLLMKLQEGTFSPELRKWRYNVVTNYTFSDGRFKGFKATADLVDADSGDVVLEADGRVVAYFTGQGTTPPAPKTQVQA